LLWLEETMGAIVSLIATINARPACILLHQRSGFAKLVMRSSAPSGIFTLAIPIVFKAFTFAPVFPMSGLDGEIIPIKCFSTIQSRWQTGSEAHSDFAMELWTSLIQLGRRNTRIGNLWSLRSHGSVARVTIAHFERRLKIKRQWILTAPKQMPKHAA
jgi:hypothetical protein